MVLCYYSVSVCSVNANMQTRNESGPLTGNQIIIEQFKMMLANYQYLLSKVLNAIATIESDAL